MTSAERRAYEESKKSTQQKITALLEENKKLKDENAKLKNEIAKLKKPLEDSDKSVATLKSKLEENENQPKKESFWANLFGSKPKKEIKDGKDLQDYINSIQAELDQQKLEYNVEKEKNNKLEYENNSLKEQLQKCQKDSNNNLMKTQDFEHKIKLLEQEIKDHTSSLSKQDSIIKQLNNSISGFEKQIKDKDKIISDNKKQIQIHESTIKSKDGRI